MTGVNMRNPIATDAAAATARAGAQKTSGGAGSDFSTIMNQTQQSQQTAKATTPEKQTSEKKKTSSDNTKEEAKKPVEVEGKMQDTTTQDAAQRSEGAKKKDTVENTSIEESSEETMALDEELIETVEEAVGEIVEKIADTLEVSEEEIAEAMEQMGLQLLDLLQPDNMAQLVAELTGEESTIGLVTNEGLYGSLQQLMQTVEEQLAALTEETNLQQEELQEVLDKLENMMGQESMSEQHMETEQQSLMQAIEDAIMEEQNKVLEEVTGQTAEEEADNIVPITIKRQSDASEEKTLTQQTLEDTDACKLQELETKPSMDDTSGFEGQQQNMGQPDPQQLQQNVEGTSTQTQSTLPNTESILKQLADFVKIQTGTELTEMELQLHPASLGTIHVQLSTRNGAVTAQLTAQNESVKTAIESQIVELRSNLEEQGVKIEAIEVSVASHEMERNLEQNSQDRQEQDEAKKTGNIQKFRRMNINLDDLDEEGMQEELANADAATRLTAEMMAIDGNTIDLLA